jgi:hypothetical protein
MGKRKEPTHVSVMVCGVENVDIAADEEQPGKLVPMLRVKLGEKDIASDLLYAACQVMGIGGANSALKDLFFDEGRMAELLRQHLAKEALKTQ